MSEGGGSVENMTTKTNETEVPACGRCGSTALHHVVYGMPTMELFDEAERRPDLSLGGCCIGPDDWSTECVTCGQRRYLGNDSSEWTTGTRPHTADLVTRYAGLAHDSVVDTATAPAVSFAGLCCCWPTSRPLPPITTAKQSPRRSESRATRPPHWPRNCSRSRTPPLPPLWERGRGSRPRQSWPWHSRRCPTRLASTAGRPITPAG